VLRTFTVRSVSKGGTPHLDPVRNFFRDEALHLQGVSTVSRSSSGQERSCDLLDFLIVEQLNESLSARIVALHGCEDIGRDRVMIGCCKEVRDQRDTTVHEPVLPIERVTPFLEQFVQVGGVNDGFRHCQRRAVRKGTREGACV